MAGTVDAGCGACAAVQVRLVAVAGGTAARPPARCAPCQPRRPGQAARDANAQCPADAPQLATAFVLLLSLQCHYRYCSSKAEAQLLDRRHLRSSPPRPATPYDSSRDCPTAAAAASALFCMIAAAPYFCYIQLSAAPRLVRPAARVRYSWPLPRPPGPPRAPAPHLRPSSPTLHTPTQTQPNRASAPTLASVRRSALVCRDMPPFMRPSASIHSRRSRSSRRSSSCVLVCVCWFSCHECCVCIGGLLVFGAVVVEVSSRDGGGLRPQRAVRRRLTPRLSH